MCIRDSLAISLVSSSIAASSDHKLEHTLSRYGLDSKWLSGYLYAFLAGTFFLNFAIVACAQYANSYQMLRKHRLDHDDPGACACCFNCLDSLGTGVVCLGYLTFTLAYLVALSMVVLGAMTCVLGAVIEVLHLLCEHTPPVIVFAALKGLEELPLGLNFHLNNITDVEPFCEDVHARSPQITTAIAYTGIFAFSQITLSICAWNSLLLLRFRKYVEDHPPGNGPMPVVEM
eukprot:TRINITY_DN573_c0_g1_i1.p1 TRINITY_DN573_c0_g1~~TRINITY_DN573_c0_g1_i1.p1  ORF type:complete len:231 (-),score=52.61 TRINITY_DN573_c0_g1_i1:50-742(-)